MADDDPAWLTSVQGRGRCAVAAKALPPGSVVTRFSGRPYASCPLPSQRERLCAYCLRSAGTKKLARCSKCKWAHYCGAACQRGDWESHKHECRVLATGKLDGLADAPAADVLLAGRCLRRRQANSQPGDDDACFDALEAADRLSESDRALGALAASFGGLLPPGDSPDAAADAAAHLIAKFSRNNFGVLNEMLTVVGAGCYPPAALLNHSCAPNCVLAFDGAQLEIRTLVHVDAGAELTHSYVDLCLCTSERRATLRERYGFECRCERCNGGLRSADGHNVDELLENRIESDQTGDKERVEALRRSAALLRKASVQEDDGEELQLLRSALALRRHHCHPLSTMAYEAECATLTCALAVGDLPTALECCRQAVAFLETALSHVPSHPLLALQRFTLSDLELACANHTSDDDAQKSTAAPEGDDDGTADALCAVCLDKGGRGEVQGEVKGGASALSASVGAGARGSAKDGRARALEVMRACAEAIEISSSTHSSLRTIAKERLQDLRALASTSGGGGVAV